LVGKKKVIVVGGGFAGIQLVRQLDERLFDVLLLDKINHHQFQPLFYQVATSQLEPSNISFPLRHVFNGKRNVQIRLAEALSVTPTENTLETDIGSFDYDYLVFAIGCKTNFLGNDNIKQHALTLKTTYDAITIRNHILQTFEQVISANEQEKESLLNIVIAGAGPTGVELAGAFAEIRKDILPKDYPDIDFSMLRIILVEGSKHTLGSMSDYAKAASKQYLTEMGVELRTETMVSNYDGDVLSFKDDTAVRTKTLIWAAGVTGNTVKGMPESWFAAGNRMKVDRINKAEESTNIFAIGDIALMQTPLFPKGHPQLANVAINQAKLLASNLKRIAQGKPTVQYEYKDLGSMATIGTHKAVVDLPFMKIKGYFAWAIWMFLHLMLILSVKNKLFIFINWATAYISRNTSLRLILVQEKKTVK
jgi:NADH:ubiquinone reductase (H+-translocating)